MELVGWIRTSLYWLWSHLSLIGLKLAGWWRTIYILDMVSCKSNWSKISRMMKNQYIYILDMVSSKSNWSKISRMMKNQYIYILDMVSFKFDWSQAGYRRASLNWTMSHLILDVLKIIRMKNDQFML